MKSPICLVNRKRTASFRIVGLLLAIAPLWLMLATTNTPAYGQTSDDVSNSSTAAASSPVDWTQFHRDNIQRWNPYETVLGVNNVGGLQLKWKNSIGTYGHAFLSSPAVVNGVAYFGSEDGNIYALNASTGAKIWSYATGNNVSSSPAVANGVVYFGSDDHNVYALNASTGAKIWSYATGDHVFSSPAVANGVVYFGSGDHNVYALNASNGAKLWSYTTGAAVDSSPAVANGVVYFGSDDGYLYALNASTGVRLWSSYTRGLIPFSPASSPAVANGVVYFCGTDQRTGWPAFYAFNASTGADMGEIAVSLSQFYSPAVANGVVYFRGDFSGGQTLFAMTTPGPTNSSSELWTYSTLSPGSPVYSLPAVANGFVYFVGNEGDGSIHALNASTGALLGSQAIGTGNHSSPTIGNGMVYVRSGDSSSGGNIYAFTLVMPAADLFLRVQPSTMTVHQGDLLTYAFPVWNLGPSNAVHEVLNTQVPAGTVFDYIRISGTPGLGTCTTPPYQGTGQVVCHENDSMAPNTTWTVRLTVKVTAPAGTVITENAATIADTLDPILANNTATARLTVQPGSADLSLRATPSTTTVHQGDLLTYAFPVWNLGPNNADFEVLKTQVPEGTTFDYIRISGTPGLGPCTHPPYQGTGPIVCHENSSMAPNTTWTVRLTVKVTAPSGTVITENAATTADTSDPNTANNTATVSIKVQ
jgi:outer membrane protein assembly factor BamB